MGKVPRCVLLPVATVLAAASPAPASDASSDAAAFERDCQAGRPAACDALARMHAEGRGVPRDVAHALQLHENSCDATRAQAIRVKAADVTRELCVRSLDADSCFALARMYEKGEGVDASADQAIALYARACQARHEAACGEEKRLRAQSRP
jgi:TPR repeat protein